MEILRHAVFPEERRDRTGQSLMLVLTRRPGQSIMIGNDVTVTVLEVRNDQVRIGVDAPRSVQVHREEIYEQIARENPAAAEAAHNAARALRSRPLPRRGRE